MAEQNQVRTLSVRQIMDSSDYARGAREFVTANRDMSQSSAIVGTIVQQTQVKISNAADGVSRMTKAYDPAAAAAIKFQSELSALNKQLETGKLKVDEASRIYAGMVQKFNMAADGADIMAQGFRGLGAVVSETNREMMEFARVSRGIDEAAAELDRMSRSAEALRAQIDPVGASQARLNKELAEYGALLRSTAIGAEEFAAAENLARTRHEQFVASLNKTPIGANDNHGGQNFQATNLAFQLQDVATTAAFMPWYTVALQQGPQAAMALQGMEKPVQGLLAAFTQMVNPVSLVTIGLIGAGAAAIHYFTSGETAVKSFDNALKQHHDTLAGIKAIYGELNSATTKFSLGGKTFVDASMRTDLAGLTKEIQQQRKAVLEQMAPNTGFGGLSVLGGEQTQFTDDVANFLAQIQKGNPDIDAFNKNIDKTFETLMKSNPDNPEALRNAADSLKVIAANAIEVKGEFEKFSAPINKFKSDVAAGRDGFADFQKSVEDIGKQQGIDDQAAKLINFGAKLLEINAYLVELKTRMADAFNDRGPGGFLLSQGTTNRDDMSNLDAFRKQQQIAADRERQAYDAQIANVMARTPQQKANAARDAAAAQYNDGETPAARSQRIELAGSLALIQAEHDLRLAKEERNRTSDAAIAAAQNELSLIGKSVAEQNRLRAAYEAEAEIREAAARNGVAADEVEIAAARRKAAAIADINAQIYLARMVQDQGYQAQQLQLEADLIGRSVAERTRSMAALQAEIQLKQQGIDTSSQLAKGYIAEQAALAGARAEIDRQNSAFQSLQDAEGSVIDDLLTSTGNLQSRLRAAASDLLKFVSQLGANGVKNYLTGTNLPTFSDLFSGKPKVPGIGSTSTPMMTVTATTVMINGGLAGISGASGLGGLLGNRPANNNVPAAANRNDPIAAIPNSAGRTRTGIPLSTISANGLTASVNSQYAGNFQGFISELQARGYNINSLGGYNFRNIAGTNKLSNHAFGDAIDINPLQNPVTYPGRGQSIITDLPSDVQSMAARYGLQQGIWKNKYDPMHFEVAKGAQPMHFDQTSQNLTKFSNNLLSSSKDVSKLGDTSLDVGKHLTDVLGTGGLLGKGAMPQNKMPTNYFPQAPTQSGGFNPFSLFTSIFSLFGFADGTDSAPGGLARINERGAGSEIINLPRGSQVIPAHKVDAALRRSGPQTVVHRYESNIVVSGNGDRELMERVRVAADEVSRGHLEQYRANSFNDDVERYNNAPYDRG